MAKHSLIAWHHPVMDTDIQQLGQSIVRYLDNYSHSRVRCTCNWCRVEDHVEDYVNRLLEKLQEICPLFSMKELLIPTGSSYENTNNIFLASEFDNLVILEHFLRSPSDPNQIISTGSDPAFAHFKQDDWIDMSILLVLFHQFISEAAQFVDSNHLSSPNFISSGQTGVTAYLFYTGIPSSLDAMQISVDFGIGVVQQQVFDAHVPESREVGQWQLSYLNFLLGADPSVARVYQMLKFLAALEDSKGNARREIQRTSKLTSYVLKTCLFRYMHYNYRPATNPWLSQDVLRHVFGVLSQFPFNSNEMTSFFNSDIVEFNVTEESKAAVIGIISKLEKMI